MPEDSFKEFVLDQLHALPELRAKAMFGAHGLYAAEIFFGILADGKLFFKTDAPSQQDFVARGMEPFTYELKGRRMTMAYFKLIERAYDDPSELKRWASLGLDAARRAAAAKRRRAR